MQISVTFRNMETSDALKSYAMDKVQRLKKYVDLPVDIHVVLAKHKYRNRAEIKVTSRGVVMKGEENTEDMSSSIDLALDKIERQARRRKDRAREHRTQTANGELSVRHGILRQRAAEEAAEDGSEEAQVVDSEQLDAKPMSVDEAVEQMKAMNNDFLVFLNAGTQDVNVIYRRRDGNIGLIEARAPQKT